MTACSERCGCGGVAARHPHVFLKLALGSTNQRSSLAARGAAGKVSQASVITLQADRDGGELAQLLSAIARSCSTDSFLALCDDVVERG